MPSAFRTCPKCGGAYPTGSDFCTRCGHSLTASRPAPAVCRACGSSYTPNDAFCRSCGQSLSRQFNANTASPPAMAVEHKQKRSFWLQHASGIGVVLMVVGLLVILNDLENVMAHQMTLTSFLVQLVAMALLILWGLARFQSGRGKSIRDLWRKNVG